MGDSGFPGSAGLGAGIQPYEQSFASTPAAGEMSNVPALGTPMRKSCQHCRKRKIRCIPSDEDENHCKACKNKGQACVFEKQSTMGRPPKNRKREDGETSPKANATKASDATSKPRKKPKVDSQGDVSASQARRPSASVPPGPPAMQLPLPHEMLPPIHAPFPPPLEYDWHTQTLVHRPGSFASNSEYTGYPAAFHQPIPRDIPYSGHLPHLDSVLATSPSYDHSAPQAHHRASLPNIYTPDQPSHTPPRRMSATHDPSHIQSLQTQESVYDEFQQESLRSVLSAFSELYSGQKATSTSANIPSSLSDPNVPAIAKVRTLAGRAISTRAPYQKKDCPSSADYARALISPLWDGLPVDIIALTTTGRPSASGPFALKSGSAGHEQRSTNHSQDEYLFTKLLREDESSGFSISEIRNDNAGSRTSPHLQYAPTTDAIMQYFYGYYRKHPLAPLLINEKLFKEDLLAGRVDEALLNVIVGSAIARAPCLGAGGGDAREIGEYFFAYIQDEVLSRPFSDCISLSTCQALLLWGTHELSHMRLRRCTALWGAAEILLRERVKRFQAKAAEDLARPPHDANGQPTPSSMQWRDMVEQELTVNALWVIIVFSTWTSLSMKLPHSTMSILAASLPAPPTSVALSSSFAYSFSGTKSVAPTQHIVRRVIERFSDATQLINAIIAIGSQAQTKKLFIPDPPRPLGLAAAEDAHAATWLLDLAKYFSAQDVPEASAQNQVVVSNSISESSRSFLTVAHAILALQQLLPATASSSDHGVPIPLPTIDSLRTALEALHLLSKSITTSAPNSRTRTQALLLDAMPRVLSLLEIFSSSAMTSLDHFSLVTTHRDLITGLLKDLGQACEALEGASPGSHTGLKSAVDRAGLNLITIADMGAGLPCDAQPLHQNEGSHSADQAWSHNPSGDTLSQYAGGASLASILDDNYDSSNSNSPTSLNSNGIQNQVYNQDSVIGNNYRGIVLEGNTVSASGSLSHSESPEDVKPFYYSQQLDHFPHQQPAHSHEAGVMTYHGGPQYSHEPISYAQHRDDVSWSYDAYPHMQPAPHQLTTAQSAFSNEQY